MSGAVVAGLIVLGFVLAVVEVFVPGGIFGIIGTTLIVAGVLGAWLEFGASVGAPLGFGCLVGGVVCFFLWVKYFPTSWLGRKMNLEASNAQSEGYTAQDAKLLDLVGKRGISLSELRPAGLAKIEEHRVDVVTEGSFVPKGATIEVAGVSSNRVVVRVVEADGEV